MNEVKRLTPEGPWKLGVVDIERAVRRNPVWLDRTDIKPDNLGTRVSVGHIYGPDARAHAHVEHSRWLVDRRLVQPIA